MANLEFRAIRKSYGTNEVLKGIDVITEDGEYLVLVGPSGCGKSTLLRCIAGLEEVTSGDLFIGGRRVNDLPPKDRNLAMVFQSYALYPHMTVSQNMGFALRVAKRPKAEIEAAVLKAAELLDLKELLDRLPAQLSGGQRQRVAMGRAIVRHPDVFLFDEPLSNLDAALRTHMRVELKRLHRQLGSTIVHVTHDQVEALTLADRILVLNEGVLQQVGTPRELFDAPSNVFVAGFIGSPAMNFLSATGDGTSAQVDGVVGSFPCTVKGAFTLGVRPTDVAVAESGIKVKVDVVESMGAEALLHVVLGSNPFAIQLREPVAAVAGDELHVAFSQIHCFDSKTGARL